MTAIGGQSRAPDIHTMRLYQLVQAEVSSIQKHLTIDDYLICDSEERAREGPEPSRISYSRLIHMYADDTRQRKIG